MTWNVLKGFKLRISQTTVQCLEVTKFLNFFSKDPKIQTTKSTRDQTLKALLLRIWDTGTTYSINVSQIWLKRSRQKDKANKLLTLLRDGGKQSKKFLGFSNSLKLIDMRQVISSFSLSTTRL